MTLTPDIEKLAAAIGKDVYIDVAKWRLYLADASLHTPVAEQVYSLLEQGAPEESQVQQVLQEIPVKLGGGKLTVPLSDLIPASSFTDLMDRLEEFHKEM
ncbi:MAG: DUF3181 family protein [Oscillatoriales cyanobacterium RM2_1_1]|nr:DUF3181 family protein [Oscillatoriales cyanobacterium SM2_3_0]NJO46370.1 DUF3181 family protein [Oscillatoriales cyanobacterium RM2_1_1]